MTDQFEQERILMVENQIRSRGVSDPRVLEAMRKVPRHLFVSQFEKGCSYSDGPLPIGCGQTISQPYIVALMTELLELEGDERVLEMGTGSGYQTAVLAELCNEVYTMEVIASLGERAKDLLLNTFNYDNIRFKFASGREGWPEDAPFDRIILTAAPKTFPENLFDQLEEGGMAVAPVGDYYQQLMRYRKIDGQIKPEPLIAVAFVPFV